MPPLERKDYLKENPEEEKYEPFTNAAIPGALLEGNAALIL
jgi:hypothetical protein